MRASARVVAAVLLLFLLAVSSVFWALVSSVFWAAEQQSVPLNAQLVSRKIASTVPAARLPEVQPDAALNALVGEGGARQALGQKMGTSSNRATLARRASKARLLISRHC